MVAMRLRTKYNLSLEEYRDLVDAQDGRCAVCRTDQPGGRWGTLVVDHDHDTGAVRGLLCNNCNIAVGLMPEPHRLIAAAAYMDRSATPQEAM